MAIPRDRTCWYCERGQHDRCPIPKTCACRSCYSSLFAPPEGDDALSREASHFHP